MDKRQVLMSYLNDGAGRGAALLDSRPDVTTRCTVGKINISTLRMDDPEFCVLGQTTGAFTPTLRTLNILGNEHYYGFDLPSSDALHEAGVTYGEAYDMLRRCWVSLINDREAD